MEDRVVMAAQGLEPQYTPVATSGVTAIYQPAAVLSVEAWVQSLHVTQFNQLDATNVQYLTPTQLASIPDTYYFTLMTAATRAAIPGPSIQYLNVSNIQLQYLTPTQVGWLTAPQVASLPITELAYLPVAKAPFITTAQLFALPDTYWFNIIQPDTRAALNAGQIQSLRVSNIRLDGMTPQQVSWLSPGQIGSLQVGDFKFLTAAQMPYVTTAQMASIPDTYWFTQITPAARAALSPQQVQALNVNKIRLDGLTTQQMSWLTPGQIGSLLILDFKFLTASQTPYLTAPQLASIPDTYWFTLMTSSARAAIPGPSIQYLNVSNIQLQYLTPTQVGWLTAPQVASLPITELGYLPVAKAQFITSSQLYALPDTYWFNNIQPATRAALNAAQIQSLRVSNIRLDGMTPQQVSWLSPGQIGSLLVGDFKFLTAAQTPYLTPQQLAAIPDTYWFTQMAPDARAAIAGPSVRYLNVAMIKLEAFTSTQVAWLTASQVASLPITELGYLPVSKAAFITNAQLASIPDTYYFENIQPATRAALNIAQVHSLQLARMALNTLTPTQMDWLTPAQVRQVSWTQFPFLRVWQIPLLTAAQLATLPDGTVLENWPDELERALTRSQLLTLTPAIYAQYMTALTPSTTYTPTVDVPLDANGVALNHVAHGDGARALALVPASAATHVAVASGDWTNPAVWLGGVVPTAGARVVIPQGTSVRFNAVMTPAQAIQTLRIDGSLSFATNVNTQLAADTIVVTRTGSLTIGTAAAPIAGNVTAKIYISSTTAIDRVWDPFQISRGLISLGFVKMFGQNTTPFLDLAVAPAAGETLLRFNVVPANWAVGDRIVLTGTNPYSSGNDSEELIIRAINGSTVVVDPLRYNHLPPAGHGLKVYAAKLTRNVQFITDAGTPASQRPHVMFAENPNVEIDNISVAGYGRTDKSIPINDSIVVNGVLQPGTGTNQRARYGLHFHHTGVNPDVPQITVRGSIVSGSAGWGYVNHQSNVVMEKNVSYNVVGAGFVTEDGNEIGAMYGNLALNSTGSGNTVNSRVNIHDFGHTGTGFWLQGPGVEVINNVAAGHAGAGFAYFTSSSKALFDAVNLANPALAAGLKAVPVGSVPLSTFSGNVSMTSRTGLEIWHHQTFMNDGESYIDNFTSWGTRNNGIELHYASQMSIRNPLIIGEQAAFYGVGILSNHKTHDISFQHVRILGFEQGIVAPPRGANSVIGGWIVALQAIYVNGANDTLRTLDIQGTTFSPATAAQLKGRPQHSIYLDGKVSFVERRLEAIVAPDRIRYVDAAGRVANLHFLEQGPGQIPFTAANAAGRVPDAYLGLANSQLQPQFGVQLAGRYPPAIYALPPEIRGFVEYVA